MWLHKLDWDDELPSELLNQWIDMYLRLSQVNEIAVDRSVLAKGQPTEIQLHGIVTLARRLMEHVCICTLLISKGK